MGKKNQGGKKAPEFKKKKEKEKSTGRALCGKEKAVPISNKREHSL